ncbi:MAG: hypothetical protein HC852_24695 [Acaryochloridaceae cyanobacterium RU_4_10]|nr:hypothetical protein [Acaryochloridaceae cyanobacterium RU_4_10]
MQTKDGNVVKRSTVKEDLFNEAKWVSAPKVEPAPTHFEKTHAVPPPAATPVSQQTEPVSTPERLFSPVVEPVSQQAESPKAEPSPSPVVEPTPKNLNTANDKVSAEN